MLIRSMKLKIGRYRILSKNGGQRAVPSGKKSVLTEKKSVLIAVIVCLVVIAGLLTYLGTLSRGNFFLETSSGSEIKITNSYSQTVRVFINGQEMGMIEAGKNNGFDLESVPQMTVTGSRKRPGNQNVYLIEARDVAGITVYSRVFDWSDFWDTDWELALPDEGERRY